MTVTFIYVPIARELHGVVYRLLSGQSLPCNFFPFAVMTSLINLSRQTVSCPMPLAKVTMPNQLCKGFLSSANSSQIGKSYGV